MSLRLFSSSRAKSAVCRPARLTRLFNFASSLKWRGRLGRRRLWLGRGRLERGRLERGRPSASVYSIKFVDHFDVVVRIFHRFAYVFTPNCQYKVEIFRLAKDMNNVRGSQNLRKNPFDEIPNLPLRHYILNRRVRGHERNVGAAREKVFSLSP